MYGQLWLLFTVPTNLTIMKICISLDDLGIIADSSQAHLIDSGFGFTYLLTMRSCCRLMRH